MTLNQLRIFLLVAERGHMTDAAKELHISQSGASAAIAALEREFGVKLFDRIGRRIELSEAGLRFLPEARAVLERASAARLVMENISQTVSGAVSIAASQTIANYWLPERLAAFHNTFPLVKLDVVPGNTQQVEQAVLDGQASIGLVEGRTRSRALRRQSVDSDRLILVVPAEMPADLTELRGPSGFTRLRWIVREVGSGTREVLEDLVGQEGLGLDELKIFLVLPSNEAVRQAVEAGAGATIISERVVRRSLVEGRLRRVPVDIPPRDFALITHRDRQASVAQQALVTHLAGD